MTQATMPISAEVSVVGDDHGLLACYLRQGDQEAFGKLVERHAGWVYAAALRQLRDRQLAEDAAQAVFLLLAQRAAKITERQKISGWLFMALRFTVFSIKRQQRLRQKHEQQAASERAARAEGLEEAAELAETLDAAVAGLPGKYRTAIILRFYEGLEFGELARQLAISEAAARKRVTRAVGELRARLSPGVTEGAIATALALPALPQIAPRIAELVAGKTAPASIGLTMKGAMTLMAMAKAKMALAVALVVALVMTAGVGAWKWTHGESAAAKGGEQGVGAAAPGERTTPKLDLSTPKNTLSSLCDALKSGPRGRVLACLDVDVANPPAVLDASIALTVAHNQLMRAAHARFGPPAEGLRTMLTADDVADVLLSLSPVETITGETATIQMEIPDALMAMLPEGAQADVKRWNSHRIVFVHRAEGWKVDLGQTGSVKISVGDRPELSEKEREALAVRVMLADAEEEMQMAGQIDAGDLGLQQAIEAQRVNLKAVLDENGVKWCALDFVPAVK